MTNLSIRCRCGASQGSVAVEPKSGMHVVCYCDDCRAFAYSLRRAELLDDVGGTELFATTPSHLTLSLGLEHLRCLRLSERGMLRWYWDCCNTPLATTRASPGAPFVSIHRACISVKDTTILGPLTRIQARYATGTPPAGAEQGTSLKTTTKIVIFLLIGKLRGANRPNPLFHQGRPVVDPRVLTPDERDALRAFT
jgi:hypothetical protein